jgi:hypothetical protein
MDLLVFYFPTELMFISPPFTGTGNHAKPEMEVFTLLNLAINMLSLMQEKQLLPSIMGNIKT